MSMRVRKPGGLLLSLDGTQVGPLRSAHGGYVLGEVVREAPGPGPFVKKHLGAVTIEDVVMTAGLRMASSF